MAILTQRNKSYRRPKKSGAAKRRRTLVQRRRLVALGMSEDTAQKLNHKEIRARLKTLTKEAARTRRAASA